MDALLGHVTPVNEQDAVVVTARRLDQALVLRQQRRIVPAAHANKVLQPADGVFRVGTGTQQAQRQRLAVLARHLR
jgi:hypothetical protein